MRKVLCISFWVIALAYNVALAKFIILDGAAGGGGSPTSVSDDFTGSDLTAWYDAENTTSCSGTTCDFVTLDTTNDELDMGTGTGMVVYDTALDDADMIVCLEWKDFTSVQYKGAALRVDKTTGTGYAVRFNSFVGGEGDDWIFRSCTGPSCTDMATAEGLTDPIDAGDWWCAGVQNTGTDTIGYFWDMGTTEPTPGTNPSFSTQPTIAWCDDGTCDGESQLSSDGDVNLDLDGTPALRNSGNYAGVYSGTTTSGNSVTEFKAQ